MVENIEATIIFKNLNFWFFKHVWTADTLFEIGAIIFSFGLGSVMARRLRDRATRAIEASKLPLATKRIAKNSRRLIFPLVSAVILGLITAAAGADIIGIDSNLSIAVLKAVAAWIAIRASLLFVENAAIRNIAFWSIWAVAALSIFGVLNQTTKGSAALLPTVVTATG